MPAASLSRTVAATLRSLNEAGLSLRVLAQDAGVDPSLVSRIASGQRTATPAVAEALAGAMERWAGRCSKGVQEIRDAIGRTR